MLKSVKSSQVEKVMYLSKIQYDGYLGAPIGNSIEFQSCRERFAAMYTAKTNIIYMTFTNPGDEDKLARFLGEIEQILDLPVLSQVGNTDNPKILWIKPSSFWNECFIRRSLFTIFLRTGLSYNENKKLEDHIFTNPYLMDTKKAVIRFMYGFTSYTCKLPQIHSSTSLITQGWRSIFYHRQEKDVRRMLVKNNCNDKMFSDRNELWI